MEDTLADAQKDEEVKDDSLFKKEIKLLEADHLLLSNSKSNTSTQRSNPLHTLHFNAMHYRISKHCAKNSIFPGSFWSLDEQITKSLVSIDDKYIQQCLESIHLSPSLSLVKVSILSDYLYLAKPRIGQTCDVDRTTLMNIMKTPLFPQFGAFENTSNSNKAKGLIEHGSEESPFSTSKLSSEYLERRASTRGNHKYESDSANKFIVSSSSSFYPSSPWSSSNSAASLYRGMLQCRWNERTPHFVFSSNDLKEIYEAKLWKVKSDSEDDQGSDYIYLFQSGIDSQNDDESGIDETRLAGKMTVSTSSSHCPNNSKTMETEFVLYGGIGTSEMKINTSTSNLRNKKRLSRKVVDVFRSKQRSLSRFSGQISGEDYCLWEPYTRNNEQFHLLENDLPSNFQLAAIVVKEHLPENHHDSSAGGWGLKFLRKVEKKQTSHLLENSVPSECCARIAGGCSTSTHILIPASLHGGPRTRNSGQSTLTERWRSGGGCDCGGWDLGCPLTTYTVRSSQEELLPCVDTHGKCKSVDIVVQGSDHGLPTLRMVNIRDDLYFIHFQPNLSSLQSFSIAMAIIHSRSPVLKPKIQGSSNEKASFRREGLGV